MKDLIQNILIFISMLISTRADEVMYAQVGHRVTLTPPSNIQGQYTYWKFGDSKIQIAWRNHLGGSGLGEKISSATFSLSGNSLIINSISDDTFGTYFYEVTKNGQSAANIITFQVLRFTVETNAASPLLPGEILSLSCKVENLQGQRAVINWVNPQNERLNSNLRLMATSQHHGQWTCVVKNNQKEHKATVSVQVVGFSPGPSQPLYTSKLSLLTIPCSTQSGISWEQMRNKSIEEVYWEFSRQLESGAISEPPEMLRSLSLKPPMTWKLHRAMGLKTVDDLEKGNMSLVKMKGKEVASGNYTCKMKIKNGKNLTNTVRVEVLKISASPGTELNSGQQLNLTCSLGHHLPSDLHLKWTSPENSLPLSPKGPSSQLTFPEVAVGISGKWVCELWRGNTQLTSDVITLKINPWLSVWMLVTICSGAVIVILILLVVFIIYRRRQRKMRHLRHRLCKCKTPQPKGFYRT